LDTAAPYCNNGKSEGVHVTYKTYTFVKYCIPAEGLTTTIKGIWDDMLTTLKGGGIGQYLFDVLNAGTPISICMVTAFAYCLLFIGLLSAFAEPLCWLCIVVVQLGLIGLPCLFGYKYYTIKQMLNAPIPEGGLAHSKEYIEQEEAQATFYILGAIGFGCLCCCFAACLWCCYSSIK
jgi:hypothetical protein